MKKFRGVDLYDLDPLLSDEERMVRQTVREFVDADLLPVIREAWESGKLPYSLIPTIAEMGLPVLGREEDAADAFATLTGLKMGDTFSDQVLIQSARGWFLSDQRNKDEKVPMNFYDEQSMTTCELFEKFFPGREDVIRLLMEPITYANGSTLEDPAISYGIVFSNFMSKGVFTFEGGTDKLIGLMEVELRKNGVDICINCDVSKIDCRGGRVADQFASRSMCRACVA